ncbi:hypothetical protein MQX03_05050 [Chryseobacterium aahli]|uniref:hypothetical protein n=1 Tax=Chryseobacterium aahli TaxID=1278643 RepID=UPI001F61E5F1|nr:hypothetical protein [Chryseobacterium aahli]MCI3936553.1 hypothetical protein [Chryseobacterium aahli]
MQKINKINQYLLEKYPTVWNTKIVWMLLASLLVHILFFIIGYLSHLDPVSLQTRTVRDDYFKNGLIFIHLIISILMIVGWLILMFKNNAFKNIYPLSRGKLFSQFVQYFVIIFASTTFYFSYMSGFKIFVNHKYPDSEMKENIDIVNRSYPFLSQNLELYTLENRLSPKPFYDLYCETEIKKVDRNKKYFVYYNRVYQYYTMYSKKSYKKDENHEYILPDYERNKGIEAVKSDRNENFETFYFKKDVVDLSSYIKNTAPSYYNFSDVFYENKFSDQNYEDSYYTGYNNYNNVSEGDLKSRQAEINRKTSELLNKNNHVEIEKLLSQFLNISEKFKIRNNLKAKEWTNMVYSPQNFEVRYFIKTYKPEKGEKYNPNNSSYYSDRENNEVAEAAAIAVDSAAASYVDENGTIVDDSISIKEFNPEINKQISPEKYFYNNVSEFYYYQDNLKDLLNNVDYVKSEDFFSQNIHIYLWISFFLSTLIFSFRITGLKSLLFSIISAGVLVLAVVLITVLYSFSHLGKEEYFVSQLGLLLSIVILLIPLLMMNKFNKLITSIFVNISLNGFVLFVLLIFIIISMYQRDACQGTVYDPVKGVGYEDCQSIIDSLGLFLSYILLVIGFIFTYFYTTILQKWKARSE